MLKKKWKQPKLIVLARGRPEERLLEYCKSGEPGEPGYPSQCYNDDGPAYATGGS